MRRFTIAWDSHPNSTANELAARTLSDYLAAKGVLPKPATAGQKQAEAVSQAFKEATGEAEVATKRDLEKLEAKMETRFERLDGKLTLIQWMLALVVAAEVVPLLATLFK